MDGIAIPASVAPAAIVTSLMQAVVLTGFAYFPLFVFDYAILDQWRDSIRSRSGRSRSDEDAVYDFIVVGSGSSGAVVANRLSKKYKVLLLEAGTEPNPLMSIPATSSLFLNNPAVDWAFKTRPQKYACQSLDNKQSLWPRGKALGGTSNLNFMAYIRGHPKDYDNWANLTGVDKWSYRNILPYFKKSENYYDHKNPSAEAYHGFGGELNIEKPAWSPLVKYFRNAALELGYPLKDINAPYESEAFEQFDFTQKDGRRWGAYQAFLSNLSAYHKLTIFKYATVTKILFDESKSSNRSQTAIGVEYFRHGRIRRALAFKEVILSAGTIGSPKLLLLSGIGPSKHLERLRIPLRIDLPGVGQNLQDHVIGFVGPFTLNQTLTFLLSRDNSPLHLLNFVRDGSGPLSSSGVLATGFVHSSKVPKDERNWPDIQLILISTSLDSNGPDLLSNVFNLQLNASQEFYGPVIGKDSFHIMSILSRPKSTGYLELASAEPFEPPIIDPQYLKEPEDLEIILDGMKKALELVETQSFQSIGAKLSTVPFPPCSMYEFKSDEYWKCYVRHYTLSVYHPVGTCSMGSVVDPNNLIVYGTTNLRVVDASVQPKIISSNIQAVCTAIGELGADLVLEKWNNN